MQDKIKELKELQTKLEGLNKIHKDTREGMGLQAGFIQVTVPSCEWRMARKMGLSKDYKAGYVLFNTSTNSLFDSLNMDISNAVYASGLKLNIRRYDL
jgi:hypothetical protein